VKCGCLTSQGKMLLEQALEIYRRIGAAEALARPHPRGHTARWLAWRRRHQARSRWFHQRTRLNREYALVS